MITRWSQAPDLIEPIVAYRAWRFAMGETRAYLLSVGGCEADDWVGAEHGWVISSCRMPPVTDHPAPDEGCACGFYAIKTPDAGGVLDAVVMAQLPSAGLEGTGLVFGRVHLAGKVIEHRFGYRAERARIAELIPTSTDGGVTAVLASRLGLAVGPALDTTSILQAFRDAEVGLRQAELPRNLTPVERVRLKVHSRHFRVITGEGGA